jgi:hypothetical protein
VSKRVTFFVISGDAGKVRRVTVSKTVIRTLLLMVVLFFSFTCFMIYDYRTSISDRIELTNLREVASEQQFMLSFFEDKFQRLEAEVSRLRVIDTRIKELIKIQRPERKGKKTYIGGTEEEGTKAFLLRGTREGGPRQPAESARYQRYARIQARSARVPAFSVAPEGCCFIGLWCSHLTVHQKDGISQGSRY